VISRPSRAATRVAVGLRYPRMCANMTVSTVIRAYNRAYVVGEALHSALGQSYTDQEVIVVDDGSTDNTVDIVEGFHDRRVRLLRHEKNQGVAAACNTGIAAATGEFVGFLDSDDLWKPDKLERQVEFLRRYPQVSAVFSDVELWDGARTFPSIMTLMRSFPRLLDPGRKSEEYVFTRRQMYLCLLQEVPIKPTALLVKRQALAAVGAFDVEARSGEDWEFFLRLSRRASFGYIDRALAIQRRTGDATHQKFRERDQLFLLDVFTKEKRGLRRDTEALQAITRGISDHCKNLGLLYLESGQRGKSIAAYWRGFKETCDLMMLARAAASLLPLKARQHIKNLLRRDRSDVV